MKETYNILIILIITILIIFTVSFLCGCVTTTCPEITIPQEPEYKEYKFEQVDGKFCLDRQGAENLLYNIKVSRDYQELLKKIIKDYNKSN